LGILTLGVDGESVESRARAAGFFDVAVQCAVFIGLVAARLRGVLWTLAIVPLLVAIGIDIVLRLWLGQDPEWAAYTLPGLAVVSALLATLLSYRDVKRGGADATPGIQIDPRVGAKALAAGAIALFVLLAITSAATL
jgi:hypothetical protein